MCKMKCTILQSYIEKIRRLKRRTSAKLGPSPHKPALLLSVITLIESGEITENVIRCSPELISTFQKHIRVLSSSKADIASPFFHLKGDKFWHLQPNRGRERELHETSTIVSMSRLHELVSYAQLDEELFDILSSSNGRTAIRNALIQEYFPSSQHEIRRLSATETTTPDYIKLLLEVTKD